MKRLLKILVVLIVVVLFSYSLLKIFQGGGDVGQGSVPSGDTIEVPALSGTIKVKDFTENPLSQTVDILTLAETADYKIVYFKADQSFLINLFSQPLLEARDEAQKVFLEKLGIETAEACRLNITVAVPYDISPEFSGRNLGLGFCLQGEEL